MVFFTRISQRREALSTIQLYIAVTSHRVISIVEEYVVTNQEILIWQFLIWSVILKQSAYLLPISRRGDD